MDKVFATALESDVSEWLKDDIPLDTDRHPREGDLRGFRTWVITMDRVILENPQHIYLHLVSDRGRAERGVAKNVLNLIAL